MTAPQLLPCPWPDCGWSVDETPILRGGQRSQEHYATAVVCPCCGLRGPLAVHGEVHPNTPREKAANQWNALPREEGSL